ncbi:MAG: SurA N-terminal domain-containing protein [Deltaproteobacteria bacterium]|nr:SurA N-terminal domain-containing protein [Deltaproteobacteria bacterium]
MNCLKKALPLVFAFVFALPIISFAETVDKIVAIINDSIITLSELNASTAMALDKASPEAKKDPKKADAIKSAMLESLIEQKLVKQAADKAGIDISEREIDNAVEDIKRQNNFTQESLLLALAQSGLTYREYREQLKEQIRQVKFINKEFRSKISILQEDIEDYYRSHLDEFYAPASFRINLIFIPNENKEAFRQKLKTVQDGINKGEDFRQLASSYSDGPAASLGGDMGYVSSGEISETLEAAALKLKPNEISKPINAPEGVYFIQLIDKLEPAPRPLPEVKGLIQDKLYKKAMDDRFTYWLAEVKKVAHIEIRL